MILPHWTASSRRADSGATEGNPPRCVRQARTWRRLLGRYGADRGCSRSLRTGANQRSVVPCARGAQRMRCQPTARCARWSRPSRRSWRCIRVPLRLQRRVSDQLRCSPAAPITPSRSPTLPPRALPATAPLQPLAPLRPPRVLVATSILILIVAPHRRVHYAVKIVIKGNRYRRGSFVCRSRECRSPERTALQAESAQGSGVRPLPRPDGGALPPSSRGFPPAPDRVCPAARRPRHSGTAGPPSLSRVTRIGCLPPPPSAAAPHTPQARRRRFKRCPRLASEGTRYPNRTAGLTQRAPRFTT